MTWRETVRHKAVLDDTQNILNWALGHYDNCVMTSAFGLNGMVLIHLLRGRIPVLFVDTGLMFPETLALRDQVENVITYTPKAFPLPCDGPGFCEHPEAERVAFCCATR